MIGTILMGLGLGLGFKLAGAVDSCIKSLRRTRRVSKTVEALAAEGKYAAALKYLSECLTVDELVENRGMVEQLKKRALERLPEGGDDSDIRRILREPEQDTEGDTGQQRYH